MGFGPLGTFLCMTFKDGEDIMRSRLIDTSWFKSIGTSLCTRFGDGGESIGSGPLGTSLYMTFGDGRETLGFKPIGTSLYMTFGNGGKCIGSRSLGTSLYTTYEDCGNAIESWLAAKYLVPVTPVKRNAMRNGRIIILVVILNLMESVEMMRWESWI